MTKPIPTWPSSDGQKYHTSYVDYVKYELLLWFIKTTDNKPASQTIVDALIDSKAPDVAASEHLRTLLNDLQARLDKPVDYELVERDSASAPDLKAVA